MRRALLPMVALAAGCGHQPPVPAPPPMPPIPTGARDVARFDVRWDRIGLALSAPASFEATLTVAGLDARIFLPPRPHRETAPFPQWPATVARAVRARVDRVGFQGGEVRVVEMGSAGEPVLWVHHLELALENVATRRRLTGGLPVLLSARAIVQRTGLLTVFVSADPFGSGLDFAGRASLRGLSLAEVSPFVSRAAPPIRVPEGRLDLFLSFESRHGQLVGAIKPVLRNVEIEPARSGLLAWLEAHTVDLLLDLVARHSRLGDVVATTVPIQGDLAGPDVGIWPAVMGVLYNALIRGFSVGFNGLPPGPPQPIADTSGIPVAASPAGLLLPGAERRLQQTLVARGVLPADRVTGTLDPTTQRALQRFQRQHHLPATGLPGYATVEALGLPLSGIFHAAPAPTGRPTPSVAVIERLPAAPAPQQSGSGGRS
jgi:hypothetical protein